jgi:hypothetical protein
MPGGSRTGSVNRPEADRYRLLLDQNYPNPPGFDVGRVDATVDVVALGSFDPALARRNTPDWLIYLRAAEAGFDAMVTRDENQLSLPEEMWVLTRIRLTLVTFRQPIEDPIVEWGQLLAYLPAIRRRSDARSSQIILLPKPTLSAQNVSKPKDELHQLAAEQGISAGQLRRDAQSNVVDLLDERGLTGRFDSLLRLRART